MTAYVPADMGSVDESNLDDLRSELAALEAAETRISAERRRLHERIDLGYSTAETRAREREVSDERRRLHRRIDSLRELLQPHDPFTESDNAPTAPESLPSRLSEWTGVSAELLGADGAGSEELEL
jgi:chromosome segregation ATPase